jgi:hypothetical protein
MRDILAARNDRGLLLRGTEGEPFANPKRRPRLEFIHDGVVDVLFGAEHESLRALPNLPDAADAVSTAKWIRRILDKQIPLPKPDRQSTGLPAVRQRLRRRFQPGQGHRCRRGDRTAGRWQLRPELHRVGLSAAPLWCASATVGVFRWQRRHALK